jgi:hypothetical protein
MRWQRLIWDKLSDLTRILTKCEFIKNNYTMRQEDDRLNLINWFWAISWAFPFKSIKWSLYNIYSLSVRLNGGKKAAKLDCALRFDIPLMFSGSLSCCALCPCFLLVLSTTYASTSSCLLLEHQKKWMIYYLKKSCAILFFWMWHYKNWLYLLL